VALAASLKYRTSDAAVSHRSGTHDLFHLNRTVEERVASVS